MLKKACNFLQAERVKAVDMNIHTGQIMMHARAHLPPPLLFPSSPGVRLANIHVENIPQHLKASVNVDRPGYKGNRKELGF